MLPIKIRLGNGHSQIKRLEQMGIPAVGRHCGSYASVVLLWPRAEDVIRQIHGRPRQTVAWFCRSTSC